jgi:hypothetical protein
LPVQAESFIHFETSIGKNIIFDAAECRAVSVEPIKQLSYRSLVPLYRTSPHYLQVEAEILKTHAIPASCSPDLAEEVKDSEDKEGEGNGEPPAKAAKGKRSSRRK